MKILHLISSSGCYGAENMLLNLIEIDQKTRSLTVLATFDNRHKPNCELYNRAIQKGIVAKQIVCRGKADWRGLRQIRELVRANEIDIIHTHGYKGDLYGHLAARIEGKPVVATCHNWLNHGAKLSAYNYLDRVALKNFDAIAAVSEPIAELLASSGVPCERIRVIPNGIDLLAFDAAARPGTNASARPDEPVVGTVARLDLQKGFEYLLNAIFSLQRSFPALRLLIVGEGPDRSKIEEMISRRGLQSVVTLAGHQTDMPKIYSSMDIFVLPSLNEGLPMTLLEAMAASKPIIATRVGAIPKLIAHRETGLLIEPADQTALTKAISQLLSDHDLSRQLGLRARAHVQRHYSAEVMVQNYQAMYSDALMAAQGSPHPGSASAPSSFSRPPQIPDLQNPK